MRARRTNSIHPAMLVLGVWPAWLVNVINEGVMRLMHLAG